MKLNNSLCVDLAHVDGLFYIIENSNGVWYTNQAGGINCSHPQIKGYLMPLPEQYLVNGLVDGSSWWSGDAEEFLKLNPELNERFKGNGKSEEAWIQVTHLETGTTGVITYANSD